MTHRPLVSGLLFLVLGCASSAPVAPDANDPAYAVDPLPRWALIGDPVTPGTASLELRVVPPPDSDAPVAWLDGVELDALAPQSGAFALRVDLTAIEPGEHELLLAEPGAKVAFAAHRFVRSHPLYVFTSVDWDRADTLDTELAWQDSLREAHPALRLTQFVGPYTFTDPEVEDRRELFVDWLLRNEADYGDETGLHIHPRCVFVDTTSVPCRTEPAYGATDTTDTSGYTVLSSAYTEEEYSTLVAASDQLFLENGLAKATSFRAGGWIASLSVLRALAANGYVADTSANNWERLEEWEDAPNNLLWTWNQENWSSIDERSQPYRPSTADIQIPGSPDVGLLEVPDNGILADYVDTEEMIEMLEANWDGGALSAPTAFSIGFHNRTSVFSDDKVRVRIQGALQHIDQHLAQDDAGPLVYATLSEAPLIWP